MLHSDVVVLCAGLARTQHNHFGNNLQALNHSCIVIGALQQGKVPGLAMRSANMKSKFTTDPIAFGDMVIALVLWLCSLPLVALIVIPLFGLKIAAITAFVLFLVSVMICWGICGWKVYKD